MLLLSDFLLFCFFLLVCQVQLGFGSGLYFLFSYCTLTAESNRDMILGLKTVDDLFNSKKDDVDVETRGDGI